MGTRQILVIDDDPGIREIIQFSLEAIAQWKVFLASSGIEGVELAVQERLDAILLDVMMPDMDGPATVKLLQANPLTAAIPTILLTAKARISEQESFRALNIAGVLTKPFVPAQLVQDMREILNW